MRRELFYATLFILGVTLLFWYIIAYAFYDQQVDSLKKFTSDGCTFFPDEGIDECCAVHDRMYWTGGGIDLRRKSDQAFRSCVHQKTQNELMSYVLYGGVRIGGVPYIKTPWRWGFGWNFGRGYR